MRIVCVFNHSGMLRHFDRVIAGLCSRGHNVELVLGPSKGLDRALENLRAALPDLRVSTVVRRQDAWRIPLYLSREIVNYANYLRPGHPSSHLTKRQSRELIGPFRPLGRTRLGRLILGNRLAVTTMGWLESAAGADRGIKASLAEKQPDLLVASPVLFPHSQEVDYIKAARAMGIPTVAMVASWDNLTSKGTFHCRPDLVTLWNEPVRREAVALHGLPEERLLVTGSPSYDPWFELRPCMTREAFLERVGLAGRSGYICYLCSSPSIAADEKPYLGELLATLRGHEATSDLGVLIRPHPLNSESWDGFEEPGVAVWPARGDVPDSDEARQEYFHSLRYATSVLGINTTGFIEAALVGSPCLSIVTEHFRDTQKNMGHFQHLLAGGFIEVCQTMEEGIAIIADHHAGKDPRRGERERFIFSFLRPRGIENPVAPQLVSALENSAGGSIDHSNNPEENPVDQRASRDGSGGGR